MKSDIRKIFDKIIKIIKNIEIVDELYDDNIEEIKHLMIDLRIHEKHDDYHDYCLCILGTCGELDLFKMAMNYININSERYTSFSFLISFLSMNRKNIVDNNYKIHEKISCILDHVTNINHINHDGYTILSFYLSIFGVHQINLNQDIISVIIKMLELGADIFQEDYQKKSAFERAILFNNYDLIALLLKNVKVDGIKGNITINMKIFSKSILYNLDYDIIELLLQYLDDIDGLDEDGDDITDIISHCKNDDIIELLRMYGARV